MTTDQPWRHHSLDPQEPTVKVVETLFKQKKVVETFLTHCIPKEIVIAKKTIIMVQFYTGFWRYLWCNIVWSPTGCMQQAIILDKKKGDQK
jgi:hypothetical protein